MEAMAWSASHSIESLSSHPRLLARQLDNEDAMSSADVLRRPGMLLGLLKSAFAQWNRDNAPRMSAALAYYTIFSLAPLVVIAVAMAGLVFGAQAAQAEFLRQVGRLVGYDAASAVQAIIQSVHNPANSALASVLGMVILLVGASGVLCEMEDALNTIWHVSPGGGSGIRGTVKTRLLSFGMVLAIGFMLLVSLVVSAVLAALARYLELVVRVPAVVLHFADFVFSLLFITLLFASIFKLVPNAKIAWNDVWAGAVLTSLLFTLGKFLIGFYIGRSISASTYGAAASLVIVVAWIYYSALLLYFGAEFTRVCATTLGSHATNLHRR